MLANAWRPNFGLVNSYISLDGYDRVFLAGDAAHRNPPHGLNTSETPPKRKSCSRHMLLPGLILGLWFPVHLQPSPGNERVDFLTQTRMPAIVPAGKYGPPFGSWSPPTETTRSSSRARARCRRGASLITASRSSSSFLGDRTEELAFSISYFQQARHLVFSKP